jgi:hypothetical protein
MQCIHQLGPNSTCQESDLIKLQNPFCIRESVMVLNIHDAGFATKITCFSTTKASREEEVEDNDIL